MADVAQFEAITLRSPDGGTTADFVPAANMVCCSLSHDGDEYLDQRHGVAAYAHDGATMGIPLLHPWANRLAGFEYRVGGRHVVLPDPPKVLPVEEHGLPIHGVIPGLLRWGIVEEASDWVHARLEWSSKELLALFPFPHTLELEARIDRGRLELATTLRPIGDDAVPVSFGFHPYLRIPGVPREQWEVSLDVQDWLVLDAQMLPTGRREDPGPRSLRLGETTFDDAFVAAPPPARFGAAAEGTRITVEFSEGFPYAQIFAPAGGEFICFEPMTAPTNALNTRDGLRLVEPGAAHRAVFMVSIDHA